ncbi:MAG: ABC transporter ATP-binding protein [Candidatus Nitrosocaldus sp.]|nr:ABC transporter ATP-binding protein [Candidatus Nitrosocaldus sp.]MDW8000387.1 ABC transporter ATP-binding protein [Candidatus Nitrosocaldus sp.]
MAKLDVRNVSKIYNHSNGVVKAIDGVSISIEDGEFVCLVGPSGCGKTTLLNIIAGLESPSEGEILLDGRRIDDTGPDRIMIFQEGALFPWLTVVENVEFGLKIAGVDKKKRREMAMHYLQLMQLDKFADYYVHQLSGGMKQRVAIARSLVMDPEVLLMDEPFAALDAQTRDFLLVDLQLLWQKTKKTILFVTHNITESVCLADRVIVFTHRPARVKKEVRIDYRRPRLIEDTNLSRYTSEIIEALKGEVIAAMREEYRSLDGMGADPPTMEKS